MDSAQWYPILIDGTYEGNLLVRRRHPALPDPHLPQRQLPRYRQRRLAGRQGAPRPTPRAGRCRRHLRPGQQKAALKTMADSFMDEAWNLPISFRTTLFAFTRITGLDGGVYDQLRIGPGRASGQSSTPENVSVDLPAVRRDLSHRNGSGVGPRVTAYGLATSLGRLLQFVRPFRRSSPIVVFLMVRAIPGDAAHCAARPDRQTGADRDPARADGARAADLGRSTSSGSRRLPRRSRPLLDQRLSGRRADPAEAPGHRRPGHRLDVRRRSDRHPARHHPGSPPWEWVDRFAASTLACSGDPHLLARRAAGARRLAPARSWLPPSGYVPFTENPLQAMQAVDPAVAHPRRLSLGDLRPLPHAHRSSEVL